MSEALLTLLREHQGLPFRTVTVFNYLLEAAVFGGLLILLLLAARRLLRGRLGSRAIYVAWLLVAVRLLVPLALPNPVMNELKPVRSSNAAARPVADQIRMRLQDAAMEWGQSIDPEIADMSISDGETEVTPAALVYHLGVYTSYGWTGKWLFFLYLAGAAATAGRMLLQNLRFRRRWKQSLLDEPDGAIMAEYRQCCEALGVKRPPAVRLADPLPSACLVGFFRPVIAVSAVLPEQDMRLALRHELAHYRAGDNWWGLLRNMCCCVQWFNPLVWIGAWASRQDGELACDERVTRHMTTHERRAYAETLLRAAAKRTSPGLAVCATGMTVSGRRLQARITDILRRRAVRRGAVTVFAVMAVAVVIMAFCTAGTGGGSRVVLANFDGITRLTEAQETAPHALLEPVEITHESEAISRFLGYMRTGLLRSAGYGVWMTERDATFTAMPVDGGWYVMMSVNGGVSQMLLDGNGGLVSYRIYIRNATERFRGTTPDNLDEAALSYVRRLAAGCLGAEVTDYRRNSLNAMPGLGVLLSGTAEIDGEPCSFEMDMSTMTLVRFERPGVVAEALQSPIDVYQQLVTWTEKQLAWGTREPCTPLMQVVREGEKLIGVVSLRAELCDRDTRRALVDGWGEAARHTLLLTFDPWGEGIEDIRLSADEPAYPAKALSEGVLAFEETVYDLVEGRWLAQAGMLPAGTTYEVLTETTAQALGVVPVMSHLTELTLLRYALPDGTSGVGWTAHAKMEVSSPVIPQMETLTVQSGGQRYSVQAYDARAFGAFDEPTGTRMDPEEAIGLAMDAAVTGYEVTAEELLKEAASYGYRQEDVLYDHYWQIDFRVAGELYEIYVRDTDGAILKTYGPGEGNG